MNVKKISKVKIKPEGPIIAVNLLCLILPLMSLRMTFSDFWVTFFPFSITFLEIEAVTRRFSQSKSIALHLAPANVIPDLGLGSLF